MTAGQFLRIHVVGLFAFPLRSAASTTLSKDRPVINRGPNIPMAACWGTVQERVAPSHVGVSVCLGIIIFEFFFEIEMSTNRSRKANVTETRTRNNLKNAFQVRDTNWTLEFRGFDPQELHITFVKER